LNLHISSGNLKFRFVFKSREKAILVTPPGHLTDFFVYLVDKTGFANVGKSTNDHCPGVGINAGQSAQMLTDLLQISQTLPLTLHNGRHSTQSSSFELFAPKIVKSIILKHVSLQ
jgi:hypothetical protein